jgi:hypothetical protein
MLVKFLDDLLWRCQDRYRRVPGSVERRRKGGKEEKHTGMRQKSAVQAAGVGRVDRSMNKSDLGYCNAGEGGRMNRSDLLVMEEVCHQK